MDFFESQQRSHRNSRVLILMMTLSVAAVVFTVSLVFALTGWASVTTSRAVPFSDWVALNIEPLIFGALITAAFIGSASLYRVGVLRRGGRQVATELGGTLVTPEDTNPLHRRLRNVVEEMAIAAGIPVPEVFVLEKEAGINAFAAGFAPEDAAIAVTRGALETLNRDELQGVVAHEYSHVFNGDMRLNIWLMGPLFGILSISLIGRMLLRSNRNRSVRNKGAAFATLLGAGLSVTGYVGLLLGRLIKASISRQREYLADATAVQYTRQTAGIAGALKKIAGLGEGSRITDEDAEEVSHMLFANGLASLTTMFASHPPLYDRIKALDPSFTREELSGLQTERAFSAAAGDDVTAGLAPGGPVQTDTEAVMASIANPDDDHLEVARAYLADVPQVVRAAIDSSSEVILIPLALALHPEAGHRDRQLGLLQQRLGDASARRISDLAQAIESAGYELRLVVLDLALSGIHQQPEARAEFVADLLEELVRLDDRIDPFEYALTRIYQGSQANAHRLARWKHLSDRRIRRAGLALLAAFSQCIGADDEARERAFNRGATVLGRESTDFQPARDWVEQADEAVADLQDCVPRDREIVVKALVTAALHDGRLSQPESELLRAFCAMLACPLPPVIGTRA